MGVCSALARVARGRALLLFALVLCAPAMGRAQGDALSRAEQQLAHGRYDDALRSLAADVARKKPRALAVAGRIHGLRGERALANASFEAVLALHRRGAIKPRDGEALWALAEAAAALGAYQDANSTYARAVAASPARLDIELAWSDLLIAKHALRDAQTGVSRVLAREPEHPRALERMARIELERGADFAAVDALLKRALRGDPELTAAYVTRAGMALRDEDSALADQQLDAALAVNPRDLEALSVRAAVRFVADDQPGFERAIAQVLAENPRFSRVYAIVATYADWEHRYPELVALSDAALALDPEDASAYATRGLNLLRIGREQEGLASLRAAWARDHYDAQVFNLLELYERELAAYDTFALSSAPPGRSNDVVVRMPRAERALLEPYAAPLIARALTTLSGRYGFAAQAPTQVEFYASPEQFAVRATGLRQLGVQGLCFGNVVIALSPRAGEFNWGQIVWHELSHVFHVQKSRGRVPRWFTEGLAEWETAQARPEWKREDDRALYEALKRGALPELGELNRAFTHAADPEALTVAYHASSLAVDYLVRQHGFPALVNMLGLWGAGLESDQVMQRALGRSLEDVARGFRAELEARLEARYRRDLRFDPADYRDLAGWRARSAAVGASADDHAGLAFALAVAGEPQAAVARAEALLQDAPGNALARFTLAHVALERADLAGAARELDALFAAGHDGYQLRMLRARVGDALGEHERALRELDAAVGLDGERPEAYALMARLAQQDRARLERATLALARLDQHQRGPVLRALALLRARGAWPELLALAESGLYRDVHAAAIHLALADAWLHTGRLDEAQKEAERAGNQPEAAQLLRAIAAARAPPPARIEASPTKSR
jgi:cellulose synthase operon protein C